MVVSNRRKKKFQANQVAPPSVITLILIKLDGSWADINSL